MQTCCLKIHNFGNKKEKRKRKKIEKEESGNRDGCTDRIPYPVGINKSN